MMRVKNKGILTECRVRFDAAEADVFVGEARRVDAHALTGFSLKKKKNPTIKKNDYYTSGRGKKKINKNYSPVLPHLAALTLDHNVRLVIMATQT